jgi:hypothetical protein
MDKRIPQLSKDAIDIDAWDENDIDAAISQMDADIDADLARMLAMTAEQCEADLRAAGVDVEAEKAKAREAREKAALR